MIFELVDNCLQHRFDTPNSFPLQIVIQAVESSYDKNLASEIRVIDNGKGMEESIIPKAFSPYGMSQYYTATDPTSLSEHGMGMKKALRGLGSQHTIVTKQDGKQAFKITTDDIKKFPTATPPTLSVVPTYQFLTHGDSHGTEIVISGLSDGAKDILFRSKQAMSFEKNLLWALGQRYRNFLTRPYFRSVGSGIFLERLSSAGKSENVLQVEPIDYSLYWNPVGKNTKPWFSNYKIESDIPGEWEAKVTLGLAPRQSEGEWEELGESPPMKGHPYYSSRRAAGFDIERKGLVLQTAFWAEEKGSEGAYLAKEWSNVFTHVRGKIILTSGFRSREEKTGVLNDKAWKECCGAIREILRGETPGPTGKGGLTTVNWLGQDYLGYRPPDDPDEAILEDHYRRGFINKYNLSVEDVPLTGYGKNTGFVFPRRKDRRANEHPGDFKVGEPDIIMLPDSGEVNNDTILCEVKGPEYKILGRDVYQLLCYMQEKGVAFGLLIGDSLSRSAKSAIEHVQNQYVTGPNGVPLGWWKRRKLGNKGKYVIGFYPSDSGNNFHPNKDSIIEQ